MPFLGDKLTSESIEDFLNLELPKVFLFTDKQKVPLLYRALSSDFNERLEFGIIFKEQKELIENYQIEKFPSIMVLEKGNENWYSGRVDYQNIQNFLGLYASEARGNLRKYSGLQDGDAEYVPELQVLETFPSEIAGYLQNDKRIALLHFFTENPHPNWEKIIQRFRGIVLLLNVYSSPDNSLTSQYNVSEFPQIKLIPYNRSRPGQSVEDLEQIIGSLQSEFRTEISKLSHSTVDVFIDRVGNNGKLGCFLLADERHFEFEALAANREFQNDMLFAWSSSQNQSLLDRFKPSKRPSLFVFTPLEYSGELEITEFPGDNIYEYADLFNFVKHFAIPNLKPYISKQNNEDIDIDSVWLDDFSKKGFVSFCIRKRIVCAIGLFPGSPESKSFQEKQLVLKEMKAKSNQNNSPSQIGVLDGLCQPELLQFLGLSHQDLPSLIIYDSKNELQLQNRLYKHESKWETDILYQALKDVEQGAQGVPADKDMVTPKDRNCAEYYQFHIDQSPLDDHIRELYTSALKSAKKHNKPTKKRKKRTDL